MTGLKLHDSYLDETFYRKRTDVLWTGIVLGPRAPPGFRDLQTLCEKDEAVEKRCDASTARKFIGSLPNELPLGEQIKIVREFVFDSFVEEWLGVVAAIHEGKNKENLFKNNPHAHISVTTRPSDLMGSATKRTESMTRRCT